MNYFSQWPDLRLLRRDGTTVLARDVLPPPPPEVRLQEDKRQRDIIFKRAVELEKGGRHAAPEAHAQPARARGGAAAAEDKKEQDYVHYLVLVFGASWHRECRAFLPRVKAFYESMHEDKKFEIIYISRDTIEEDMLRFYLTPEAQQRHPLLVGTADAPLPYDINKVSEVQVDANELHGDYYSLQFKDLEEVGVPLLYHYRVTAYPALVVIENTPPPAAPLTPSEAAADKLVRDNYHKDIAEHNARVQAMQQRYRRVMAHNATVLAERAAARSAGGQALPPQGQHGEGGETAVPPPAADSNTIQRRVNAPSPPAEESTATTPASHPPPHPNAAADGQAPQAPPQKQLVRIDTNVHRRYRPTIVHRRYIPREVTVAGKFYLDVRDPVGEFFPWKTFGPLSRASKYLIVLVVFVACVTAFFSKYYHERQMRKRQFEDLF